MVYLLRILGLALYPPLSEIKYHLANCDLLIISCFATHPRLLVGFRKGKDEMRCGHVEVSNHRIPRIVSVYHPHILHLMSTRYEMEKRH